MSRLKKYGGSIHHLERIAHTVRIKGIVKTAYPAGDYFLEFLLHRHDKLHTFAPRYGNAALFVISWGQETDSCGSGQISNIENSALIMKIKTIVWSKIPINSSQSLAFGLT